MGLHDRLDSILWNLLYCDGKQTLVIQSQIHLTTGPIYARLFKWILQWTLSDLSIIRPRPHKLHRSILTDSLAIDGSIQDHLSIPEVPPSRVDRLGASGQPFGYRRRVGGVRRLTAIINSPHTGWTLCASLYSLSSQMQKRAGCRTRADHARS